MFGGAYRSWGMQTKRIENSINYVPIISWVLLVTMVIALFEVWILLDNTNPTDRAAGLAIGVVLWMIGLYSFGLRTYYLGRPKSVDLSDQGVNLNMRLGKRPVVIAWPDVRIIGFQTSLTGREEGLICNDIVWYYPIDRSIAVELREAYRQRMGLYPPKSLDELCPGMLKDRMAMSSNEWNRKYERFKKKD